MRSGERFADSQGERAGAFGDSRNYCSCLAWVCHAPQKNLAVCEKSAEKYFSAFFLRRFSEAIGLLCGKKNCGAFMRRKKYFSLRIY